MLSLEEQIARVVDEGASPVDAAEARRRSRVPHPRRDRRPMVVAVIALVLLAVAIPATWRANHADRSIHVGGGSTSEPVGAAIGEPIGQIYIPTIDVDWTVVQGADAASEATGPTHDPDSPMPGAGGNALIAGHRTTHGAPFFRLDELKVGDVITFRDVEGTYRFAVDGSFIVDETSDALFPASVLERVRGRAGSLTLITNHPRYSAAQRLVVTATLEPG